jgi:hypothetical protein
VESVQLFYFAQFLLKTVNVFSAKLLQEGDHYIRLPLVTGGLHMAAGVGGATPQDVFVQVQDRKSSIKSGALAVERKSEDTRANEDRTDEERRSQKAAERGGIDIQV